MNINENTDKLKTINKNQEKYGNRGLLFLYIGASCIVGTMAGLTFNQNHLIESTLFATYISLTISLYSGIRKKILDFQEDEILKKIDSVTENNSKNMIAEKIEYFQERIVKPIM